VCFRYGVTPGSNVALLLVPSTEFTLLQLAAIKLGAAALPFFMKLGRVTHYQAPPSSASTRAPAPL
jgi:acyl-CoA synthetase (AMP-forming)/AMP-acid ligase II